MRHAKSDWSRPGLDDHDRALNERGRRAAAALGQWLRTQGDQIDEILCSTALRTRQTCAGLDLPIAARFEPALYLGDPSAMTRVLATATGRSVLLIAHNPGIAEMAQQVSQTIPAHPRFGDYPTGATSVVQFDAPDWGSVTRGRLAGFTVPRDLL